MDGLIDKSDRKKIRLLRIIFDCDHHICSFEKLTTKLGVSNQTVLKLVDAIKVDICSFEVSELFSLNYSSTNLLFSLFFSDSYNFQMLLNAYLRKSIKFKLLKALFSHSFNTLQELADFLDIPYIQVRRVIQEINQLFDGTSINIYTKKNVFIRGNEIDLRFFYTILFLTAYGAEKWPFHAFTLYDISTILEESPLEVYNSNSLDKYLIARYYIAVHLFRERQGHHVEEKDIRISLYQPYSVSNQQAFGKLVRMLKKYLPYFSGDQLTNCAKVLCSSLVALGGYSAIKSAPDFFLLDKRVNKKMIPHLTFYILDRLDYHLFYSLSLEEYNQLSYSLMCVHYRTSYIGKIASRLQDFLPEYLEIDRDHRKQHKIQHFKKLIELEMKTADFELYEEYSDYLTSQYCIIYDDHLNLEQHTEPINISFLSILSNKTLKEEVIQYFSPYFNLNVVTNLSREIDLIISEIPISSSVISTLRLNKTIIYCNQHLVDSDYTKICAALTKIAQEKFKINFE